MLKGQSSENYILSKDTEIFFNSSEHVFMAILQFICS